MAVTPIPYVVTQEALLCRLERHRNRSDVLKTSWAAITTFNNLPELSKQMADLNFRINERFEELELKFGVVEERLNLGLTPESLADADRRLEVTEGMLSKLSDDIEGPKGLASIKKNYDIIQARLDATANACWWHRAGWIVGVILGLGLGIGLGFLTGGTIVLPILGATAAPLVGAPVGAFVGFLLGDAVSDEIYRSKNSDLIRLAEENVPELPAYEPPNGVTKALIPSIVTHAPKIAQHLHKE